MPSAEEVDTYLGQLAGSLRQNGGENVAEEIDAALLEFRNYHWHEMSQRLLRALKTSGYLIDRYVFHEKVLSCVRADIAPIVYVQLVYNICMESGDNDVKKSVDLIEEASVAVRECSQSRNALKCVHALLLLRDCNEEDAISGAVGSNSYVARKILDEVEQFLQTLQTHEVEPLLVGLQCLARGLDYELRRMYSVFYNNAFDVVKHAEKAEMPLTSKEISSLAKKTAIAGLLSEETFNFGRFLNFDVFVEHLGETTPWLLEWVNICNEGNVSAFKTFWTTNESNIREIPELFNASSALLRKVELMALLHLVFYAPFNERVFSFLKIAERCGVDEEKAEPLLLEALAQGIIRGKIDGLCKTVQIGWVEPRVLNLKEVFALSEHVSSWRSHVEALVSSVSAMTSELAK